MRSAALFGVLLVLGCGATPPRLEPVRHPLALDAQPDATLAHAIGARFFVALSSGGRLCGRDDASVAERLLETPLPEPVRCSAGPSAPTAEALRFAFRHAHFVGVCLQGARIAEPPVFGLTEPAWVFERALVIAETVDETPLATWVEGLFAFTDTDLAALRVDRIQQPRPGHSDLEMAECDLEYGFH